MTKIEAYLAGRYLVPWHAQWERWGMLQRLAWILDRGRWTVPVDPDSYTGRPNGK